MRIHTNTLSYSDFRIAMSVAGVVATTLEHKGSRKRGYAYEIKLSGDSPFRQNGGTDYAATWDQWGIFLAALYSRDPDMIAAAYMKSNMPEHNSSKDVFEYATNYRFDDLTLADSHRRHNWIPLGNYTSRCECGAWQQWDHLYPASPVDVTKGVARVAPPATVTRAPKVVVPPQLPSSDASWQLWTNDDDRKWFENIAERSRQRSLR